METIEIDNNIDRQSKNVEFRDLKFSNTKNNYFTEYEV